MSSQLTNQFWLESDLSSQTTLDKKINKRVGTQSSATIAWLYWENRSYYVTDMETKLVAVLDTRFSSRIQPILRQARSITNNGNNNKMLPLVRVRLKSYSYSSMPKFNSKNRESHLFMMIDDMDIVNTSAAISSTSSVKSSAAVVATSVEFVDNFDSKKLKIGSHPLINKTKPTPLSTVNTNVAKSGLLLHPPARPQTSILSVNSSSPLRHKPLIVKEKQKTPPLSPKTKHSTSPTNLSQLVNELTNMSSLQDCTINLVRIDDSMMVKERSPKEINDLNQALLLEGGVGSSGSNSIPPSSVSSDSLNELGSLSLLPPLPSTTTTRLPQLCSQLPANDMILNTQEFSVIEKDSLVVLQQQNKISDNDEIVERKIDNSNCTSDMSSELVVDSSHFADSTSAQFVTSTIMIRDTQRSSPVKSTEHQRRSVNNLAATLAVDKLISAPTEKVLMMRNNLPQSTQQALVPTTLASSSSSQQLLLTPNNVHINLSIINGGESSNNWDAMSNRSAAATAFSTVSSSMYYSPSLFTSPSGKRKRKLLESVDSHLISRSSPSTRIAPRLQHTPIKQTNDKILEMDAIIEENTESVATTTTTSAGAVSEGDEAAPAAKKKSLGVNEQDEEEKRDIVESSSSLSSESTHDLDSDSISLNGSQFGDDDDDSDDDHDSNDECQSVLSGVPVKSILFAPKHYYRAYSGSGERRHVTQGHHDQQRRLKSARSAEQAVQIFSPKNRRNPPPPHHVQTDPIDRGPARPNRLLSSSSSIGCHMVDKFVVFDKTRGENGGSPKMKKDQGLRRGLLKRRSLFDMSKQNLERAFAEDDQNENEASKLGNNTTTSTTSTVAPPQEVSTDKSIPSGQNDHINSCLASVSGVSESTTTSSDTTGNQSDLVIESNNNNNHHILLNLRVNKNLDNELQDYLISLKAKTSSL